MQQLGQRKLGVIAMDYYFAALIGPGCNKGVRSWARRHIALGSHFIVHFTMQFIYGTTSKLHTTIVRALARYCSN